ncbi:MAG TPA: DegT/DnrJ/EryC1/StrS family aminotransferase [Planctomycetota bacterium]|nr:DegT/DnrJ/EryC1/StrS family aminotransferase [Planctomycetota bacterium]HRR81304.1 DegT/DnrJ/EryC1/StrS family aminotransferase [Planctomycetota bacterium]HRT95807.1 DegT/DnrJ/EryC1/StrS family aminotransferase [Planctomycetota bacterium]
MSPSSSATPALLGGEPAHTGPWPAWPVHDERERSALLAVLESGQWWYGERVREFEERFAAFQDARFGITCTNGTAALELALIGAGIGAGMEVIVPPYTFVATATAVLKANAVPVFVDIELDTLNLDAGQVEAAITDKTAAVLPVHFAGLPADMDRIGEIARRRGLKVIEDSAHGWGSKWRGKGCGALGHAGGFSFQQSKNITSAEGGIVLTDDPGLADTIRSLSNVGRGKDAPWYEHYLPGGNYRMTEFQAALLLAQLTRLPEQTALRARNAALLNAGLAGIEGLHTMREDARANPRSYHLYGIRIVAEEFGLPRERFIEAMRAEGVPCGPGYPHPLYRNPLFQRKGTGPAYCPVSCPYYGREMDYTKVVCPNAERACREVVWLSQSMLLGTEADMHAIVAAARKIRRHAERLR